MYILSESAILHSMKVRQEGAQPWALFNPTLQLTESGVFVDIQAVHTLNKLAFFRHVDSLLEICVHRKKEGPFMRDSATSFVVRKYLVSPATSEMCSRARSSCASTR